MTIDEFRRRLIALLQQTSALPPGDVLHELEVERESLRGHVIRARIDRGDPAATGTRYELLPAHGVRHERKGRYKRVAELNENGLPQASSLVSSTA